MHCRPSPSRSRARRNPLQWLRVWLLAGLTGLLAVAPAWAQTPHESDEIWLKVDTSQLLLRIMRGDQILHTFEDIAIGRYGTTRDKRRLDGRTPLGEFRISRINNESSFRRFYGFDYPHLEQAERALQAGDLDPSAYVAIRNAVRSRRLPPQTTVLGGYLGIHGLGTGDPEVHENFNWTNGCIALTNEQIDRLAEWVGLGTRVVVY